VTCLQSAEQPRSLVQNVNFLSLPVQLARLWKGKINARARRSLDN
jgi:hypothetical protein